MPDKVFTIVRKDDLHKMEGHDRQRRYAPQAIRISKCCLVLKTYGLPSPVFICLL